MKAIQKEERNVTDNNAATAYLRAAAPYPTRPQDVTADGLARSLTVSVIEMDARMLEGPDGAGLAVASAVVSLWATVRLLRAVAAEHEPRAADALAREIWTAWAAGDSIGTSACEWAAEYGMDADRLAAEAGVAARGSRGAGR